MTTRTIVFDSPFLLGFEHTRALIERATKAAAETYPPYNVEQLADDRLRITLAVAGFTMDDLSVQIEDMQLVIRGKQTDDRERLYLHRGIAARQFQRSFVLAEGIEVAGASLDNGLLHIDIMRPLVEPKIRKVEIKAEPKTRPAKSIEID